MNLKFKKRKLWILNTTILTIVIAIVPIAVNCGNDVKVSEISIPSGLQDKTKMQFSGNHGEGKIVNAFKDIAKSSNYDIRWSVGTELLSNKKSKLKTRSTIDSLKNGDYVWIEIKVKNNYKFKALEKDIDGWKLSTDKKTFSFKKIVSGLIPSKVNLEELWWKGSHFRGAHEDGKVAIPVKIWWNYKKYRAKLHKGVKASVTSHRDGKDVLENLKNGDKVSITLKLISSNYIWAIERKGWETKDSTQVLIKEFTISGLSDKEIPIANLLAKKDLIITGTHSSGTLTKPSAHSSYDGKMDYEYYKGDSSSKTGAKIATFNDLRNGDFVWVFAVAKKNYRWPNNVGGWTKVGVDNKKIKISFEVTGLSNKEISIEHLHNKATLESGRWNGREGVIGTMKAYALPAGIVGNVDIEYYQSSSSNTIGTKIDDLSTKAFDNRDFVWIRLVAKVNYVWPNAADVTAKGWTRVNTTTIQIKLIVSGLIGKMIILTTPIPTTPVPTYDGLDGAASLSNINALKVLPGLTINTDYTATITYFQSDGIPLKDGAKLANGVKIKITWIIKLATKKVFPENKKTATREITVGDLNEKIIPTILAPIYRGLSGAANLNNTDALKEALPGLRFDIDYTAAITYFQRDGRTPRGADKLANGDKIIITWTIKPATKKAFLGNEKIGTEEITVGGLTEEMAIPTTIAPTYSGISGIASVTNQVALKALPGLILDIDYRVAITYFQSDGSAPRDGAKLANGDKIKITWIIEDATKKAFPGNTKTATREIIVHGLRIIINISNLQSKTTLETRRWNGVERVAGTMAAYTLPDDISSKADVKYYQGDRTTTIGVEIVPLSSKAFANGDFVWIRLVAKDGYAWPSVAVVNAKEWERVDNITIQIKLIVGGLGKEVIDHSNLVSRLIFSGIHGSGSFTKPLTTSGPYQNKVTYSFFKGNKSDKEGIALENINDLANGDYVWVVATTLTNYRWPNHIAGWIPIGIEKKQIKKGFIVTGLSDFELNDSKYLLKHLSFRNEAGGIKVRIPTWYKKMILYQVFKGTEAAKGSTEVITTTSDLRNDDYVWLVATTKTNYKWHKDISASGWTRIDERVFQKKFKIDSSKKTSLKIVVEDFPIIEFSGVDGDVTFTKPIVSDGYAGKLVYKFYKLSKSAPRKRRVWIELTNANNDLSNDDKVFLKAIITLKDEYTWGGSVWPKDFRGWHYDDANTLTNIITIKGLPK